MKLMGYWYVEGNANPNTQPTACALFSFTARFLWLLKKVCTMIIYSNVLKCSEQALWIPEPFSNCAEIFGLISAKDIANILLSLWMIIRYFTSHVTCYHPLYISLTVTGTIHRQCLPTLQQGMALCSECLAMRVSSRSTSLLSSTLCSCMWTN